MMASSFCANSGSLLTLNVRDRCGFKPCLCQMRRTLFSLRPAASAIVRVLQWVALKGLSCVVFQTTSCTLAGVMVGCTARPRCIFLQAGQAHFQEPLPPASCFLVADADLGGDLQILLSGCCQQDHTRSFDLAGRQRPAPRPLL